MDRDILYEYDEYLLGNITSFSRHFFNNGEKETEENVVVVCKYVIEDILKWSPYEARDGFNKEIVQLMKLDKLIAKIKFPGELNPREDFFYVVYLIYPDKIKFNERELVLKTYKSVLNGELYKFPKEYLDGNRGIMRICICLQYMLSQYFTFNSIQELYRFFTTPEGSKALKKYRLYPVFVDKFELQVDYLHQSLPNRTKNEFWYNYYRYQVKENKLLNKIKKSKKDKKEEVQGKEINIIETKID